MNSEQKLLKKLAGQTSAAAREIAAELCRVRALRHYRYAMVARLLARAEREL